MSDQEREDLVLDMIEHAALLMALALPKHQVKRNLEAKFDVDFGQRADFERIRTAARQRVREITGVDRSEEIQRSSLWYFKVLRDPSVKMRYKLKARRALDSLLGLDARFGDAAQDPGEIARRIYADIRILDDSVPEVEDTDDEEEKD